jgi:hypothetical protein
MDDLDVVVEEEQQIAARGGRAGIARRREVERAIEWHDDAVALVLERPVQLENGRLGAAVVDDDQLTLGIARSISETVHALGDDCRRVPVGNDDGDKRSMLKRPHHPVTINGF